MNNRQIAMRLQSAIAAHQQQDISDCRAAFDTLRLNVATLAADADHKVRTYARTAAREPYAEGVYDYARDVAAMAHDYLDQSKDNENA